MSFLNKIWGWLSSLIKKIWAVIKKVLPYILLALAVYFMVMPLGTTISMAWAGIPGLASISTQTAMLLAAGAALIFAPEETVELVGKVADTIGDAAGAVIEAGIDVAGDVLGSLFSSPIVLIGLAVGAYLLFGRDRKEDERDRGESRTEFVEERKI